MKNPAQAMRSLATGLRRWLELMWIKRYQASLDTSVMFMACESAYRLTYGIRMSATTSEAMWRQLPYVMVVEWVVVQFLGIHKILWRYIGFADIHLFVKAALWSVVPVTGICLLVGNPAQAWQIPVSIALLIVLLTFGGFLAERLLWRLICERKAEDVELQPLSDRQRTRVVLIGAGAAGERAASEILRQGSRELDIRGFLDDDRHKQQSIIHGIKVLGTIDDLPRLVKDLRIDQAIITIAQCEREQFRRLLNVCAQVPLKIQIIPTLSEILRDGTPIRKVRDIGITDLLGREPVELADDAARAFVQGKCVMVTGAGGSIGSELVRRVARYQPSCILLVERSEFALFTIDNEIRLAWPGMEIIPLLADVSNRLRLAQIFEQHHPHIVLHAAAHKHVPLIENNVTEAITNNVVATQVLGDLAAQKGVEVFVLISSDKAVRPRSVMGASKRLSELIVQELNRRHATQFVTVRFGNVMGSTGSVVLNFEEQIRKGGPVTVTHPEMERYFMTIPEAAQLVLEAAAMGERGEVFVLDMGKPVRVLDLAKEMILLSGLRPFEDIDIIYTGIRPGEKLFEELSGSEEKLTRTRHPKVLMGQMSDARGEKVFRAVETLIELSGQGRVLEIKKLLSDLIPDAQFEASKPAVPQAALPATIMAQRATS